MPLDKSKIILLPKDNICSVCGRRRSYSGPIAKCYECRHKFCYQHIFGGQINNTMGKEEIVRDVCEKCRELKGYRTIK